jgi:hypothetical protein
MSGIPPSGSRTVPSRARKSGKGVGGGFGAALKAGAAKTQESTAKGSSSPKKTPQVRIARSTYSNLLATKILKAAGIGFLLVAVIYLCFAVTIVRVLPTTTAGLIPVKNITFPGGLIPAGETVVVDMENQQGSTMVDYLKQSFVPNTNASVVKVEAGPWGNFNWNNGVVVYDEEIVPMAMPEKPAETTLENSYLVTCVEGACVPGQGYVIHTLQILGQPLSK